MSSSDSTHSSNVSTGKKFGTFKGVFTPSILTILGVIMYLRMGWVVGNVGVIGTLAIVSIASGITFLTALSIAATSTNMKVGGGGAYFMISRSLGVEAGAAIGIPLYFAQSLGVAFYLAGFSESFHAVFPALSPTMISLTGLLGLAVLAYISSDIALKIQFFIFAVIICSLLSFFMGGSPTELSENGLAKEPVGFWSVFAVFFPAVTGIEAGLSMSGDLKSPSKSLPLGTLAAVLFGFVVYVSIPIFMAANVDSETLRTDRLIMERMAFFSPMIVLGIWGASISSTFGALLGAPRTLQALARDRVVPAWFAKSRKSDDTPQVATLCTFLVALSAILLGDLDSIAPVLSMFFLTSYGMLNFSAGIEGAISNPSWRPNFRFPWVLSVIGSFACFAVMFMIDAGATIISLLVTFGVYYVMQKRKMTAYWGDMRRGILNYLAKHSLERLSRLPKNTKSWRPNVLVFAGAPARRWYLVELGHAFSSHAGMLSVATILPTGSRAENRLVDSQKNLESYLGNRDVSAFVRISVADDVSKGIVSLVRDYGLGPMVPNTIVIGETELENSYDQFAEMIIRIYQVQRNCIIVRVPDVYLNRTASERTDEGLKNLNYYFTNNSNKRIDIWWGRQRNNAGLALALGFLLQNSESWNGAGMILKSIALDEEEYKSGDDLLKSLVDESRLDAEHQMYLHQDGKATVFEKIQKESQEAGLTFLGMAPPDLEQFSLDPEAEIARYTDYYSSLIKKTDGFPPMAFVLAAEDLDFHKIFMP